MLAASDTLTRHTREVERLSALASGQQQKVESLSAVVTRQPASPEQSRELDDLINQLHAPEQVFVRKAVQVAQKVVEGQVPHRPEGRTSDAKELRARWRKEEAELENTARKAALQKDGAQHEDILFEASNEELRFVVEDMNKSLEEMLQLPLTTEKEAASKEQETQHKSLPSLPGQPDDDEDYDDAINLQADPAYADPLVSGSQQSDTEPAVLRRAKSQVARMEDETEQLKKVNDEAAAAHKRKLDALIQEIAAQRAGSAELDKQLEQRTLEITAVQKHTAQMVVDNNAFMENIHGKFTDPTSQKTGSPMLLHKIKEDRHNRNLKDLPKEMMQEIKSRFANGKDQ